MSQLTIDLPSDVYERLCEAATRAGKDVAVLAGEWLVERLSESSPPVSERERAREVLRAAGLLAEPTSEMRAIAARSTASLDEIHAIFARAGGKPLSEIVIEQRGPKA